MLRTGRTLSRAVPGTRVYGRKYLSTDVSNSKTAGGDGGTFGTKLLYMAAFVGILDVAAATGLAYQMENDPQWEKLTQLKREHPDTHDALAKYHGMLVNAGLFKGANLNKATSASDSFAKKLDSKQNNLVQDAEKNAKNNKDSVGAKKDAAALKTEAANAKAQADAAAAQKAADAVEAAMKAKADKAAQEAAQAEAKKLAQAAEEVRITVYRGTGAVSCVDVFRCRCRCRLVASCSACLLIHVI